ncbi:MAG: ribosome biogenesis GTPase Der [bacterium]|nr:ribosome biogenesis GTPase Der [bacterium]
MATLPTIALIGRTNVGKSRLFNRLTESVQAIVSPQAGTTRDRTYGTCLWRGRSFRLVDTGGADVATVRDSIRLLEHPKPESTADPLGAAIVRQTQAAIREAEVLLLVVDGRAGIQAGDRQLARVVQRLAHGTETLPAKTVVLVCNKIDNNRDESKTAEFLALGLGDALPVSGKSGRGTGELLDVIAAALPVRPADPETPAIRLGLLGRPNVGKSSLANRLLGMERSVVSPEPLTTREALETPFTYQGHNMVLVDTAGIKPWKRTDRGVATVAQQQSLATLRTVDVVLLLVEAQQPISHQDQALASLIAESKTGSAIIVNKWDLVAAAGSAPIKNVAAHYHAYMPAMAWAPVMTVSAATGQNTTNILDLTLSIWQRRLQRVDAAALQELLAYAARRQRPRGTGKGKAGQPGAERPRLVKLEQTGVNPPTFTLWMKPRQSLHFTYQRFVERLLVEKFDLGGTNCKLYVQQLRAADRRAG